MDAAPKGRRAMSGSNARAAPTSLRTWMLWGVLSAAAWGGIAAIALAAPFLFWSEGWAMLFLHLKIMPVIGGAALGVMCGCVVDLALKVVPVRGRADVAS